MCVREVSSEYQTDYQLLFISSFRQDVRFRLTSRDQEQDSICQEPNSLHPFPSVKLVINQESSQVITT